MRELHVLARNGVYFAGWDRKNRRAILAHSKPEAYFANFLAL